MSRAQKNVRLRVGPTAPESSGSPSLPDVTQKDSAENIAGDVNRVSTDDYKGFSVVKDDR